MYIYIYMYMYRYIHPHDFCSHDRCSMLSEAWPSLRSDLDIHTWVNGEAGLRMAALFRMRGFYKAMVKDYQILLIPLSDIG